MGWSDVEIVEFLFGACRILGRIKVEIIVVGIRITGTGSATGVDVSMVFTAISHAVVHGRTAISLARTFTVIFNVTIGISPLPEGSK